MGIIASRDTRRISFDNTFSLSLSALGVSKSIENESIIGFDELPPETNEELIFADKPNIEVPEDGEVDYWTQRIDNLKKEHQIVNKIVEAEYDKQIARTEKAYEPPRILSNEKMHQIQPCFDLRSKIMQCYEDNPHQPLMCSSHVQAFANCVASCRAAE